MIVEDRSLLVFKSGVCDVCGIEDDNIQVYALPGVPISIGSCVECLKVGAYPYSILVANTILLDGLEDAADWWKDTVNVTLEYLQRSKAGFLEEVKKGIQDMNDELERMAKEWEENFKEEGPGYFLFNEEEDDSNL